MTWPTYEELARGGATLIGDNYPPQAWHREMQCQAMANACTLDYDNTHLDNGIVRVGVFSLRDIGFLRYHVGVTSQLLRQAIESSRNRDPHRAEVQLSIAQDRLDWLIKEMGDAGLLCPTPRAVE